MIEYVPGEEPRQSDDVEFVDGPRAGERATLASHPDVIEAAGGRYRRSVSCAEDGARRYLWVTGEGSVPEGD